MKIATQTPFRYQQIIQELAKKIESGEFAPASRLPSEPELARAFDVNQLTVRRALAELEKDGKILRQQGRGTFVRDRSREILSIVYAGRINEHYYQDQFMALNSRAQAAGYRLTGVELKANSTVGDELLATSVRDADALIVGNDFYTRVAPLVFRRKLNLVVIDRDVPAPMAYPAYCVLVNEYQAMVTAVRHVAALGHRRIALAGTFETTLTELHSRKAPRADIRVVYEPYRGALVGCGIHDWELYIPLGEPGREEADRVQIKSVLSAKNRPTAIVCDCDYRGRLFFLVAAELGLVIPRDLSLIGMFDTPWCTAFIPALTSVNMDVEAVAEMALRFCAVPSPSRPMVYRVDPRVVERASCAPPPAR